ncbi:MAG: hypothetical protein ABI548_07240 [Polyangiaceae bacterium]
MDTLLNPRNLGTLEIYLKWRGQKLSVGRLLLANLRLYVMLTCGFSALGAAYYWLLWTGAPALLATALATTLLRDIGYFYRTARAWPDLERVMNWPQIEAIVAAHRRPALTPQSR